MAYAHTIIAARDLLTAGRKSGLNARRKPGFFGRIVTAMQEARLRQAEREIALYLSRTGGKFTDEGEREIERRFLGTPGR